MYGAERFLWLSVVHHALKDIQLAQTVNEYERAKIWFETNSDGFKLVCDLAGLDRESVKERAKRIIIKKEKTFNRHRTSSPKKAANLCQIG